jgi:hypothetical protein
VTFSILAVLRGLLLDGDFDIFIIVSRWQYVPCNLFPSLNLRLTLRIFHNITHERTAQQDRWLVQVVVFVAQRSYAAGFEDQTRVVRDVLANPAAGEGS